MSVAPKPRAKQPSNGKRQPARPAGCQYRSCAEVERAGDVGAVLARLIERVDGLDRHVGVLAKSIEGVKDGVSRLTALQARAAQDAGTTLRLVQALEARS